VSEASPSNPSPPTRPAGAETPAGPPTGPASGAALLQLTVAALDSISEGFVILDRDWRFVLVNPAAERFTQQSSAELLGRSLWECFPQAEHKQFGAEYRRAVAENVQVEFEEFYPAPLNAWFEVRAQPSGGGLSIFFRDVTARRKMQDALRQSEERYRALFNSMAQGFVLLEFTPDANGVPYESRFLDVNPAFERLTGLNRDDVIGKLASTIFPADHALWGRVYAKVVLTGEPLTVDHYSPGTGRHYEVFAYRPDLRQIAVLFHDVTEHLNLEEALRVNLTKYKVLFDSFPLGISVTDSEGKVREINRRASLLLHSTPEAVLGQRIGNPQWRVIRSDGSPMPPEELASVRAVKEQAVVEDVETGIARPGEEVIWISVTAAPLPLEGYGPVITYGDISRRKRAEDRLTEAHRDAETARARLEAVMEALPTGVAIIDAKGGQIKANAAFHLLWGPSHPIPKDVADYREFKAWWLDTGRAVLPEEWASARAVQHGETVIGQLMEIERFDGGRRVVLNSAAPIVDDRGAITGCAVAIHDISRRVEAESALAKSQAELVQANRELLEAVEALRQSNQTLEARVDTRTADLARRTAQLRALALDLTRAEERERKRVAEVIHDHLQQLLSVARINLGMALGQVRSSVARKTLKNVDDLMAESLGITRSLTAELSPAILHRSGLAAALRWLGRWYGERFGLNVAVEAEEDVELDGEARVTLFRAVRELLFNVVKHAAVTEARVRLSRTADGRARIVVSDEGAGFDPEMLREWNGTGAGFGLFSLRERLDILGGQFEVSSSPGGGTSFTISGAPPRPAAPETPPSPPAAPLKIAVRKHTGTRHGRPSRVKKR
jgi:PAS domain S-box-containing protein